MEFLKPKNSQDNRKGIAEKVISILIDYESDLTKYNNAIEDYNELGGIDGISEIMSWDESQKLKWSRRIQNVYNLK